ncbi:MAG: RNA methyltransferase [Acidobacteriota bacterium]|nr:RNA methyltransferase [Blastocatellia bacterium]MDW8411462.1 RNA methyltransferase [Acidobacteriota bacterium]
MIVDTVTSKHNPLIKRFREARQGRNSHLLFIEGIRLVEEAIASHLHFELVAFSDRLRTTERGRALQTSLDKINCRGAHVSESIMQSISDVESPQGIAAIVRLPYASLESLRLSCSPLLVIAHKLRDPGNIGTLVRSSEAAGVEALITTPQTVDPFNLKALRAAMGAAFRLPIVLNSRPKTLAQFLDERGISVVAADPKAVKKYYDYDWTRPVAILLGQEADGLDKEAAILTNTTVSIPMKPGVDSLNVATAGAVLLFEAARQRAEKAT